MSAKAHLRQLGQLGQRRAKAKAAWRSLSHRDQRLMLAMGAFLLAMLVWLGGVKPALRSIDHWERELPRLRSQAAALQSLLAGVQVPPAGADVAEALRESLDNQGLRGHYQLGGDARTWRLQFDEAPASATLAWLRQCGQRFNLNISEAQLLRASSDTRSTDAGPQGSIEGRLSGFVRMEQAPGAKEAS
ncbi:type II secretion system protein GspM [Pseudomonas huanghezhanensis]|uniref:type II secretion system protein GspM n=1 Tax=Pseudomonas huanghezhanensis TaxID=3002903 RepID=UPI0022861108|nr:type II secretion system protein GspM [Pseudomonas sp. BSw22131]